MVRVTSTHMSLNLNVSVTVTIHETSVRGYTASVRIYQLTPVMIHTNCYGVCLELGHVACRTL